MGRRARARLAMIDGVIVKEWISRPADGLSEWETKPGRRDECTAETADSLTVSLTITLPCLAAATSTTTTTTTTTTIFSTCLHYRSTPHSGLVNIHFKIL
ncbi:hypothetical protein E2C01_020086 [Portunus trituberculatus]|uniref:Uncharacterized protein n=1 Tax=Portunus trituberculatus TaxID=210409 RepID=A0A5B7E0D7_PORTR|nr:hypothetical protein [Portunus trituberculatus]